MSDGMPGDREDKARLVVCSDVREDCDGCEHSIAHEPKINGKQEICTDSALCLFHEILVQCQ